MKYRISWSGVRSFCQVFGTDDDPTNNWDADEHPNPSGHLDVEDVEVDTDGDVVMFFFKPYRELGDGDWINSISFVTDKDTQWSVDVID